MKVIVDTKDYNLQEDKRLLIPYMEEVSRYGIDIVKVGLMDKNGDVVIKAKYDFVIGESIEPDDIIVLGTIKGINDKIPYSVNPYVRCTFSAFNARKGMVIEGFDTFTLSTDKKVITVHTNSSWGAVNSSGEWVIPYGKYTWIDGFDKGFVRARIGTVTSGQKENDAKWSLITDGGIVVYSECHDIKPFYGKGLDFTEIIKNQRDKGEIVYFKKVVDFLNGLSKPKPDYNPNDNREWLHRYDGSIDDAYEGEQDARWNTE